MSPSTRRRPSVAFVVAILALLMATSGTAYAAGKAQAGDKLILKSSLSGNRLKTDTLTGKQIKESSLGKVKAATKADTATKAKTATEAVTAKTAAEAGHATTADSAGFASSVPTYQFLTLPLTSGWVVNDYDSTAIPAYDKDLEGYVHLEGAAKYVSGGAVIATLPAGFRPFSRVYVPVYTLSGSIGSVLISPNGEIQLITGNSGYVSLEGITFPGVPTS